MMEALSFSSSRTNKTDLNALLADLDAKLESCVRMKEPPQKIKCIGEGSHGKVYSYQLPDNSQIAGKKAKINLFSRSEKEDNELSKALHRALNEVNTLKQLDHNHVIKFVGCYWDAKQFVLFTKLMEGGSIKDLLRSTPLSEPRALRYVIQAVKGLSFLHNLKPKPIVHRDIKCANFLLDNNDTVKLADFGVALGIALDGDVTRTVQQTTGWPNFEGSVLFAASEVRAIFIEKQVSYGRKADVWSLACAIVEMLTGEPPYIDDCRKFGLLQFIKLASEQNIFPYSGALVHNSYTLTNDLLDYMFEKNRNKRPSTDEVMKYLRVALSRIDDPEFKILFSMFENAIDPDCNAGLTINACKHKNSNRIGDCKFSFPLENAFRVPIIPQDCQPGTLYDACSSKFLPASITDHHRINLCIRKEEISEVPEFSINSGQSRTTRLESLCVDASRRGNLFTSLALGLVKCPPAIENYIHCTENQYSQEQFVVSYLTMLNKID